MSEEQRSSDSLDQAIDGGIDKAMAAKGAYDTAKNIGAAAAEAGKATAQTAASTGASASAAAGTGAAAGTAAGPAGTVMGAVVGLAVGLFGKPLAKALILIGLFIVMIFTSLPSMFFEHPIDVADNTGPIEVYRQFKEYAMEKYDEELDKRKEEIEDAFQERVDDDEFDDYDEVVFTYSFNPSEEVFREQLMESSTLIIAMFEIATDDWRKATFEKFKAAVNSVHFWNDTISATLADEEQEVERVDGDKILYIHQTWDVFDHGVEQFRSKFGLDDERDYIKSVEMAYNIKIYFGEVDDLPMGGTSGGGATGSYPGGGTHNAIRQALADLEEPRDFFGGSPIVPIEWYYRISSEFGPRNYAPDPIHTGIDFSADIGTKVYSAMDGIVLAVYDSGTKGFGKHIVVYHGGGVTTMYAHLSAYGSYGVGASVSAGDVIGYVGKTGLSTGPHLHFEYQINGSAYNPRNYLPPL